MKIHANTVIKTAQTFTEISRIMTLVIGSVLSIKYTRVAVDARKATITMPVLYLFMLALDLLLVFSAATLLLSNSTHFSTQELIIVTAAISAASQTGMILFLWL